MTSMMDGEVSSNSNSSEFGKALISKKNESPIIKGFFKNKKEQVWMSHGDIVSKLPKDLRLLQALKSLQTQL